MKNAPLTESGAAPCLALKYFGFQALKPRFGLELIYFGQNCGQQIEDKEETQKRQKETGNRLQLHVWDTAD